MTVAPRTTTTGGQADLAQQLTKELAAQMRAGGWMVTAPVSMGWGLGRTRAKGQHRPGSSMSVFVVASVS